MHMTVPASEAVQESSTVVLPPSWVGDDPPMRLDAAPPCESHLLGRRLSPHDEEPMCGGHRYTASSRCLSKKETDLAKKPGKMAPRFRANGTHVPFRASISAVWMQGSSIRPALPLGVDY
jgi:hypothetical protein